MTMIRESDYYIWLLESVTSYHPGYTKLIKQLDSIQFRWIFALDENRAAGGINLRAEFSEETSTNEEDVRTGPCSVLEMLIGVATQMESILCCDVETWFWVMCENLCLDQFTDDNYDSRGVNYIVETWLNRNYMKDGAGSIFPLKDYSGDCRNLDIWSQMNAWINENYPTDNSWLN